jgi:hypothetical protein
MSIAPHATFCVSETDLPLWSGGNWRQVICDAAKQLTRVLIYESRSVFGVDPLPKVMLPMEMIIPEVPENATI